jgi:hypothetical protein
MREAMSESISFKLYVDERYTVGFMVRTMRLSDGKEITQLLTRYGEWIPCTREQIREQDIPSECMFATHDVPSAGTESSNFPRDLKDGG